MHGDCHLPHKEKTPSRRREKTAVALLCAGVDVLSWSSPMEEKKVSVCLLYVCCCKASGRKEGTAGRLSQAYPLVQQDILSLSRGAAVLLTWLGIYSIQCGGEASRAAHTLCTHCACTRATELCLAEGGFCVCSRARTHRTARTHTYMNIATRPLTSLPHRNPIGFRPEL